MNAKTRIIEFTEWFRREADRLRSVSSQDAASEICEQLLRVDERLGVEIERSAPENQREIIFTSFSDATAFPIVREIVSKIGSLNGWNPIPLKPARGFGFSLTIAGIKIKAGKLRFRPLSKKRAEYQIIIPDLYPTGEGANEAAWLMVETGIGEELASCVTHLEFGSEEQDLKPTYPIDELAQHIRSRIELK